MKTVIQVKDKSRCKKRESLIREALELGFKPRKVSDELAVELTSNGGTTSHLSDDMESGMDNWDDAAQVFNMSLHYEGDYRLILSPFTFGKVNTSSDREDMVGRALDWLRAAAAADDVGVKVLKLESETNMVERIKEIIIVASLGVMVYTVTTTCAWLLMRGL